MTDRLATPERPEGASPPSRRPPPPSPRLCLAAAAAGVVAAAGLPGERPGLGILATALAVAIAAARGRREATARGGARAAGPPRDSAAPAGGEWGPAWAALAILCASVAVVRDAQWVVWPAILGAVGLGSVAVAGRVGFAAPFAALLAAPRGARTVALGALDAVPANAGRRATPLLRGAAIAAVLVLVFGVLFASGDAAFAQLAVESLPEEVSVGLLPFRVLVFVAIAALVGGLIVGRRLEAPPAPRPRLRTAEWAIPLAALDLLFAAFVAVQLTVLFGGDDRVLQTAGLTYAEYAREGYGQLLVAALLTLALVGGALRWASGDRRLLRALLAVLCLLTGVVLASALHRLDLYQDAFGATRLRVTATATLLWLGAILALVVAALALDRTSFLPRTSLLTTVVAGLAFAAWNPDLRIAERNLARASPDRAYLRTLSADARPALPPDLERPVGDDGWGGWNIARR
ncbi:MAG TPA: DUF4173 domain-containing protein [Solirubrobacteraceae bacterium]|jgi:hypothetical protein